MVQGYLCNLATDKYKGFIPGVIKIFLYLLSFIYSLVIKILLVFYHLKPYRLNCKVISVGNITLGGTGKTSLVEYIAKSLKQQGHKVAILSRGYKKPHTAARTPNTDYETMGDEPYMLSKNLEDIPVLVDADRVRVAKKAIRDYAVDTIILDDGFQQWGIKKDLEIVTIDSTKPFGNYHLIPRGILREPLSSLKRADIFILTKTNLMPNVATPVVSLRHPEETLHRDTAFGNPDIQKLKDFLSQLNPQAQIFESIHKPIGFYEVGRKNELLNRDKLKGKTVTLISGIADPDSFENLIINLGIKVGLSFRFSDHYHYTQKDLDRIVIASQDKGIDTIVTTEKDAVRFYGLRITDYGLRILFLRIELKLKDEQRFNYRLLGLYSG